MRFSTIASVAIAAGPAAVVATQGALGFALGDKLADGSCKFQADYEQDFATLKSESKIVRGYDAYDCNTAKEILPAAKAAGFKVILGIWPDVEESYNNGKNAVKTYANQYPDQVYAVTVGSETLYRGNFTGDELASKITEVKSIVPKGVKVGTADSWNKYNDGTANPVVAVADIILINAFAYWQGASIDDAVAVYTKDIKEGIAQIQKAATGPLDIFIGETGWPTGGSTYGSAVPGVANAQKFWKDGICLLRSWGYDTFVFEAFDEPWKPLTTGDNGQVADETHWGVYTADRKSKYSLAC